MQTLHQFQGIFEQYLIEHRFTQAPSELYEPVNYILGLGGKRFRPVALLISCHLFSGKVEPALPAAFAIEIFHNFTLLHDDIMDAAPLRRGKPTVHQAYNVNTGILSGDVMLVLAYEFLLRTEGKEKIPGLLSTFTKTAVQVCEGQQMDMNFEVRSDVTIGEYLKMIELKTSVLLAAAMKMGALVGGASGADAERLYEFGRNLGIAFQLQDDVLDTFGEPQKFGKKTGGDIAQNKKTFLYLKALEMANKKQKEKMFHFFTPGYPDEQEKIAGVMEIFEALKVRKVAEEVQEHFRQKALVQLKGLALAENEKKQLESLAQSLMNRET